MESYETARNKALQGLNDRIKEILQMRGIEIPEPMPSAKIDHDMIERCRKLMRGFGVELSPIACATMLAGIINAEPEIKVTADMEMAGFSAFMQATHQARLLSRIGDISFDDAGAAMSSIYRAMHAARPKVAK